MPDADVNLYLDPVCPSAWMTSKWLRLVLAQRDYAVDWRFISLRLINANVDYDSHFPAGYEAGHTAGLRLLRVAARVRTEHGREAAGALYAAMGARIFDPRRGGLRRWRAPREPPVRRTHPHRRGPAGRAGRRAGRSWLRRRAAPRDRRGPRVDRQGRRNPIIHFRPPDGVTFFGPMISRLPSEEEALPLWDNVVGLATFSGFAELKRSLRELPQLRGLGVEPDEVGGQEDWHGGSRRRKR